MLYFFHGTDTDKAREKAHTLTEGLRKKKPDAEMFRLESERASEAQFDELIHGQGLFNKSHIVYSAYLFENDELKEMFLKRLEGIGQSPNIFVSVEGKVDKKTLLAVADAAEKVQLFEKKEDKKRADFNIFSLTDAFGKRDKRNLWVLFRRAVASGAAPEEIHGILFWQIKSMLLATGAKTAGEAGVAPFVFTKSRNFLKNYSEAELTQLSSAFVSMYHDAHRGIHDFEIALERFVLTL
ncbi:MAG: hypothetical protein AAB891_01780 [Patescibacteria group bacterium]